MLALAKSKKPRKGLDMFFKCMVERRSMTTKNWDSARLYHSFTWSFLSAKRCQRAKQPQQAKVICVSEKTGEIGCLTLYLPEQGTLGCRQILGLRTSKKTQKKASKLGKSFRD